MSTGTSSVPSAPLPTRISARQAQRRNMPKPRTPHISESQGRWIIGGSKSDERKLLERMVEYLHIDPLRDGDPLVLRFLLKDWKQMQNTLHTIGGTMENLKQVLSNMKIPYLRRMISTDSTSTRTQKWEYWNNYTTDGMVKFHADNKTEATITMTEAESTPLSQRGCHVAQNHLRTTPTESKRRNSDGSDTAEDQPWEYS